MKLNREGVQLNAEERNKRNQNWATLEDEVSQFESATTDFNKTTNLINGEITGLKAETAAQKNGLTATNKRVDNVVIEAGTAAYEKVVDASKLIWKEPVVAFSNLATAYPQPQNGWAVQTTSDGAVYRYDGSTWKKIQQVDAGPVNALDTRLTAQLADKVSNDRNFEYGTKFVAHAGANVVAPESTNPAFVWAGKAGYKYCETDVQITSDGEYIVKHDDTVDRMTNGTGKVVEMTLAQIQSLTIDSGANITMYPNLKVPTLDDFLKICIQYSMIPVIEYKPTYPAKQVDIQKLIDILDAYNLLDSAQIISFNGSALTMIRSLNKRITLQFLADPTINTMNFAKTLGNTGVGSVYTILTKEYVDTCHKNGVFVGAWTVNDYDIASKFRRWGVDFITTNKVLYSENLGVY